MKIWCLLVASSGFVFSKPQPPQDLVLDPDSIEKIGIHAEMNTLLIFPDQVTLVMGKGLTDGSTKGVVQYEKTDNPKVLVIRHLGGAEEVLMQVMVGEEAFVFRVHQSENPATVIRFGRKEVPKPAKKISPEKTIRPKSQITTARRIQLIMFARSPSLFQDQFPEQFKNFKTHATSSAHRENGVESVVTQVSKFGDEDALIVSGTVTNQSAVVVSLSDYRAFLQVGEKRTYRLAHIKFGKSRLAQNKATSFEAILIGDGRGGAAHLSPENQFRLRLFKSPTLSKQ